MATVYGRRVFETLRELVDPQHTAILVVDMQKEWCHKQSSHWQTANELDMIRDMVPRLVLLIEEARKSGALIVWIQHTSDRAGLSNSPSWIYFLTHGRKYGTPTTEMVVEGSWGHQLLDEFQPLPNEPVIRKHRSSAFEDTDLDLVLRSNGIKTTIAAGIVTQGCVESTVRGASSYDYYVVVVKDCVASYNRQLHEDSLKVMASLYDCVTLKQILAEWAVTSQDVQSY